MLRFRKNISASGKHAGPYQRTKNALFDRGGYGQSDVPPAIAQSQPVQPLAIIPKSLGIPLAGFIVEGDLYRGPTLGVSQLQFTVAGGCGVFSAPDLNQENLVSEVSQVLQWLQAIHVVEKIRKDQRQAALRIGGDELARHFVKAGAALRCQRAEELFGGVKTMPAAAGHKAIQEARGERLQSDVIVAHQADVGEGGGQTQRVLELGYLSFGSAARHRSAGIEQKAHRYARLHLEHFEEQLFEPHISAPVDGAEIVAMVEIAMIQKLLTGAGEARGV